MMAENLIADVISIIASVVAFLYVFGIWRMVRAKSRLLLLAAMAYMVATRAVILTCEAIPGVMWIETHRSIIIVPQYIIFAVAFAMTYYELRDFHFDVPRPTWSGDDPVKRRGSRRDDVLSKIALAVLIGIGIWAVTCLIGTVAEPKMERIPSATGHTQASPFVQEQQETPAK
ncbi:MAG: hypothetical protein ABFE13_12045 [Phycisphaerales bacterium]